MKRVLHGGQCSGLIGGGVGFMIMWNVINLCTTYLFRLYHIKNVIV